MNINTKNLRAEIESAKTEGCQGYVLPPDTILALLDMIESPAASQSLVAHTDAGGVTEKPPIDCRSNEGVLLGLIDGVIATARVIRTMDQSHPEVQEALADIRTDDDVAALVRKHGENSIEGMEDPILVPRGLIGAACFLIRKHTPESNLLPKLREYTTGSKSTHHPQAGSPLAAQSTLSMETIREAAKQSGFERSESCCMQPLKFCEGDEWRGNLEGFAKALLRLTAATTSCTGKEGG